MSATLTIRTDSDLRSALETRAAAMGKSLSELVREILTNAVSERPMGERIGHLAGVLDGDEEGDDPWQRQIREHNWRP